MSGSLWNGYSGIANYEKGISVESNNLANSNTVGHKSDQITFSDMMYGFQSIGKGVNTQSISKAFSQGSILQGTSLDVAINGSGFFTVRDSDGSLFYTRAGNFRKSNQGKLETIDSYNVLGVVPQGKSVTSSSSDSYFTNEYTKLIVTSTYIDKNGAINNLNLRTTDYSKTAKSDNENQKGDNYKTSQNKINDIGALKENYIKVLNNYKSSSASSSPSNQISYIDFMNYIENLQETDNKISLSVDGKTYISKFDSKNEISDIVKKDLYNFLSNEGRSSFGLIDPASIPTDEEIENLKNAIVDQSEIDNMPTSTPEEIAAKEVAQQERDKAVEAHDKAIELRQTQEKAYASARNIVLPYKDIADQISSTTGFKASVKDGFLRIESIIPGASFKITDVKINTDSVDSQLIQQANAGSGEALLNASREALKNAVEEAGGKFLEINTIMNYTANGPVVNSDINLDLKNLGLFDTDLGDVSIEDGGFVYVTNNGSKFLVGKISTAAFRNEQGLEAMGGNKYRANDLSGDPFNADSLNKILSNSLERSNVDYSATLTAIMIYQRAYEANAKTLTTSDEFIKTAIDLIK